MGHVLGGSISQEALRGHDSSCASSRPSVGPRFVARIFARYRSSSSFACAASSNFGWYAAISKKIPPLVAEHDAVATCFVRAPSDVPVAILAKTSVALTLWTPMLQPMCIPVHSRLLRFFAASESKPKGGEERASEGSESSALSGPQKEFPFTLLQEQ